MRVPVIRLRAAALGALAAALAPGCLDRPVASPDTRLRSGVTLVIQTRAIDSVDLLFEIDNSNSMSANQANLARNFGVLIDRLVDPPRDERGNPRYPPARSLHVGVISSDLGTPGSVVPSCADSDVGDDGLLNPIRNGRAIRAHQPWTSDPGRVRPARCAANDRDQYPSFLAFDAASTDPAAFRDDFVCNAFLSVHGCGLEQQLEAAYRALVVHDPRARTGNTDPNAGFVRPDALLAIVLVTDEEDGSARDCRYAEAGVPCADALGVFDATSAAWASADLNQRFYLYAPGSAQDPTWDLDRYMDPRRPDRGFTSLKPGYPERVIFAAIAGVPIDLPRTPHGTVDYDALLGTAPDGSDGYTGTSHGEPVSMRQRNPDPACPSRVVPACRGPRTGATPDAPCAGTSQYVALPSRRVVEVARRFARTYNNGTVSSVCRDDYSEALEQVVYAIAANFFHGRCLPRVLSTNSRPACCDAGGRPAGCVTGPLCATAGAVSVHCTVRERLPASVDPGLWCIPAHGRRRAGTDRGRDACLVDQVAVRPGMPPPPGAHGFYYDTRADPANPPCTQRITFVEGDEVPSGAEATIECVQADETGTARAGAGG